MAEIRVPLNQRKEAKAEDLATFSDIELSDDAEVSASAFSPRVTRPVNYNFRRPPKDDIDKQISRELESAIVGGPKPGLQVKGDQQRINRAQTTAATLDIPFSMAYDGDKYLSESVQKQDKGFFSKAGDSWMMGMGDLMVLGGRALELGTPEKSGFNVLGLELNDYGKRLQKAYMPTEKPEEFTYSKMLDKDWWATTPVRSLPVTLSLIPAAVVGMYAGGATAGAIGLGALGRTILGAIGGGLLGRPIEAGFEASGAYEEAISRGKTDEEARSSAQTAFKGNLALAGTDIAQLALAFTPLKLVGGAPRILQNRIVATATRLAGTAALEAGEEIVQEGIQQYALGDPVEFNAQMKEAGAIGAIFGLGLGGAGSVYQGITNLVESKMTPQQAQDYEAAKERAIGNGATEEAATVQALDEFTESPGGKAVVEKTFKELKDLADGKEVEPITQEEMQAGIEESEQIVQQEEEPEAIGEEVIEAIVSGEAELEEVFGLEKLELESAVRGGVELEPAEPKTIKQAIRLTTGQEKLAKTIREDEALTASLRKASMYARLAFKAGSEKAVEAAKAEFRNVLTLGKVKAEASGFKKGEAHGQKITRKELLASFKDSQKEMEATRKALTELIEEELPLAERGKYLDALISRLTKAKQTNVVDRVVAHKERLSKKEQIAELKDIKNYVGNIPVEYQRRVQEIVGDISLKHFTANTVRKLASLRDYADDQGMPSGVSYRLLNNLEELTKKDAQHLTSDELKEINEAAKHLIEMGKLKQKLLKYKEKREFKAALKDLVDSTVNADFDTTKKGGKLAREMQDLHIRTLNAIRVTQIFDGFKNGENVKYAKDLMHADKNAQLLGKVRIAEAMEEIAATGVKFNEETNIRLMINLREQEGAENAVTALADKYGKQVFNLSLSPEEQKVIDIIQKYSTMDEDKLAAMYEERENKPFVRLRNYILPLKYENQPHLPPAEAIQHHYRTAQTQQGFTETRKKGVDLLPSIEILEIFEKGINEKLWYLNMQPVIDDINALTKTKEYIEKGGEVASNWWKDHLDIVARQGWSAKADHKPFSDLLRKARGNIGKAVLGYKVSSILMQPFAIFDAMVYAQSQYGTAATGEVIKEFAKSWVVPGYAKAYIEGSQALQLRASGAAEMAIVELREGKKLSKFMENGLALLLKADVRTAAATQSAIENILTKQGVPNAKEEAGLLMEMSANSSDVTFRPHVLASGEAARTWFTFQNFMLNRWGMISHDLITKGLVKGDAKAKISASIALGIIVAATLAENEARKFLYETILRRQLKERSLFTDTVMAIPSHIPYFGDIYNSIAGRPGDIPVVKIVTDVMRAPTIPFGKKKPETRAKLALRAAEAGITLTTGIPGTGQVFDVVEGIFFPGKETKDKPKQRTAGKAAR